MLLDLAELRIKASRLDIKSVVASGLDLIFSFAEDGGRKTESLFSGVTGKVRISDTKTVYVRLTENYFEPNTLITVLRKILGQEQKIKIVSKKLSGVK